MGLLVALGILSLAAASAGAGYGGGYGTSGSYGGGYGSSMGYGAGPVAPRVVNGFFHQDLTEAEDFIHRVNRERTALLHKVTLLKDRQQELLNSLQHIQQAVLPHFTDIHRDQTLLLDFARDVIKGLLHTIWDQEAEMAGEEAMSRSNEAQVNPMWASIHSLQEKNNHQQSLLDATHSTVTEARTKLQQKLAVQFAQANSQIDELKDDTENFEDLVNIRHCTVDAANFTLDPDTGVGHSSLTFHPPHLFGVVTPTVYCALQDLESSLHFDVSHGYGVLPDLHQRLGLSVDCKAFSDNVTIVAVDLSQGAGNAVSRVGVQVKACSFGPQA